MSIWPGVWHFSTFYSRACLCVFELLYVWLLIFEGKRYMRALLHFVCLCGTEWGCVQGVNLYKRKKRKGNQIQCWMNYGVCIVIYCVLLWVREWMEFMCERCRNKNRKTAVGFRHCVRYCMNCLRLPCRTDTSEINRFSPFAFNKNMSPS